jgi:hypothetical protein
VAPIATIEYRLFLSAHGMIQAATRTNSGVRADLRYSPYPHRAARYEEDSMAMIKVKEWFALVLLLGVLLIA